MIDEKINNSLKELEQGLKNVESARKQVEKTVNSYDGLNATTAEYVNKLGTVTNKIQEIVDSIGKDYAKKVTEFEKDRETDEFNNSLSAIQTKLKYSLIVNAVSLIAIIAIIIMLLK